jgi:hypothetical protein
MNIDQSRRTQGYRHGPESHYENQTRALGRVGLSDSFDEDSVRTDINGFAQLGVNRDLIRLGDNNFVSGLHGAVIFASDFHGIGITFCDFRQLNLNIAHLDFGRPIVDG